jgi:general stress protein YciG
LIQKYSNFDGAFSGKIGGKIGGLISGRKLADSGFLASLRTPEHQRKAAKAAGILSVKNKTGIHNPDFDRTSASRKGGLVNVESGHLQSISSKGGLACGALMEKEKKGIFSPDYDRVAAGRKYGKISGKIGGPKGMHIRWHVNRGLVSDSCKHCKQGQVDAINTND